MKDEADKQRYAAGRGEQDLLAAVVVGVVFGCTRRPDDGAHPGCGYRVEDGFICYISFVVGDRHPAVQDIESESLLAADEWTHGLFEHRDFFRAVQPAHLVGASGPRRCRW